MKIKISEKILSEFIGADLEVISGNEPPLMNNKSFTNFPKGDAQPPQTSDDFAREARVPWWSNYWGTQPIGIASTNTIYENQETQVSENQVSDPKFEDIRNLYGDEALYSIIKGTLVEISHIPNNIKDQKDISVVNYLVAKEILASIDVQSMSDDMRNSLKSML